MRKDPTVNGPRASGGVLRALRLEQARLIHNTEMTVHDIAREERLSAAYIYTLLRLRWLAPDITAAIINGRQPPQLNAMKLMRQA